MRWMKWIGLMAAVLLIASCFTPWVFIESKNITVSGVDATGTNFGKPGYFHFIMTTLFVICSMIPRVWAKRSNLLICAFNLAWSIRNFILISTCRMGECPEKKSGLYLTLLASAIMLLTSFFPDIKLKTREPEKTS
ncbi:MAG: hypothetical protein ABUT20_08160 [Bacteroidota bacterium]